MSTTSALIAAEDTQHQAKLPSVTINGDVVGERRDKCYLFKQCVLKKQQGRNFS